MTNYDAQEIQEIASGMIWQVKKFADHLGLLVLENETDKLKTMAGLINVAIINPRKKQEFFKRIKHLKGGAVILRLKECGLK